MAEVQAHSGVDEIGLLLLLVAWFAVGIVLDRIWHRMRDGGQAAALEADHTLTEVV